MNREANEGPGGESGADIACPSNKAAEGEQSVCFLLTSQLKALHVPVDITLHVGSAGDGGEVSVYTLTCILVVLGYLEVCETLKCVIGKCVHGVYTVTCTLVVL